MPWTTDDLVSAVKRKVLAPSSGFQLTDPELLEVAWEETIKRLVPAVRSVREDYWTTTKDFALTYDADLASYPAYVRIPTRAASSTMTSFWLLVTGDPVPKKLLPISASERQRYINSNTGIPGAYSLEGDRVYLYVKPGQAGLTLRVQYDRRPSRYVAVADTALISTVTATVATASGGAFVNGTTYSVDIVQAAPPCDVLLDTGSGAYTTGAPKFTFAAGVLPGLGVAVGDYVALAGYTCIPPLPDVLHPVLVDITAAQVLGDLGFVDRRDVIREDLASYMPGVLQQLAIRKSADPSFAFNRNSPLRSGRGAYGGSIR